MNKNFRIIILSLTIALFTTGFLIRFQPEPIKNANQIGSGSNISINTIPTLTNGMVTPATGNPSTLFTYSVTYTDLENNIPLGHVVYVRINDTVFPMNKEDPSDYYYIDGCNFTYSTTLPIGNYEYLFNVTESDDSQTVILSIVTTSLEAGPTVTNTAPILTSGGVSPAKGDTATIFTYSVTYIDADNQEPVFISVVINGTAHTMMKQDPGDTTYIDGCIYTYVIPTGLAEGLYTYYFNASDGTETVKLPANDVYYGPIVRAPSIPGFSSFFVVLGFISALYISFLIKNNKDIG